MFEDVSINYYVVHNDYFLTQPKPNFSLYDAVLSRPMGQAFSHLLELTSFMPIKMKKFETHLQDKTSTLPRVIA